MSIRYLIAALAILIATNVATTLLLVRHHSAVGYAEITIQSIWVQRLATEICEHDIKRGEQKAVRFYVDERDADHACQIVVNFGEGQGQTCDVVISNGEKGTVYVYADRLDSDILKRTTPVTW